ncbi:hypothetical protein BN873_470076 [Candidatus Competibacter denitrificans Run_A_D11]|uniref:Uncharacterized protein n=1 Tax=Candidatus Competibacter denitrificans Run_A_D11 TaxID=1400863 RepID=W6M9N7_9GAMM|nr:hypothetical protein BN873_470076 [Candidatus Competibacter denitrificans Run_A_D11]
MSSGRQGEAFTLMEHGPRQTRILGGDGHDRLPIPPALFQRRRPAADGVGLGFGEEWWAPEQASMPITHGGKLAINSCSLARYARTHQGRLAVLVHPMYREHVLGKIDPDIHNSHDFPSRVR